MARVPPDTTFIGQLPVFQPDRPDEEVSNFRNVPASDRGNADYSDQGMLGNYSPQREPWGDPPDVRHFIGYGASAEDLNRGYARPVIREDPAYDMGNYKDRFTRPKTPDTDDNPATASNSDLEFRRRSERSRGFFTRPHLPIDR